MANRAYLSIWTPGFSERTMLDQFEHFLRTVPFSADCPGFTALVIHAVEPAETPLDERDFRNQPADAAAIAQQAREHLHSDSAYEVHARWDLWVYDLATALWQRRPESLEIFCHGEEYDGGVAADAGYFQAALGFEHLFTGHARLLGSSEMKAVSTEHPAEAEFLARMTRPENLWEYHQKTRENIQQLTNWIQAAEEALPMERYRLWSEGEENLEARLDEILAVH
jgi:hypothetical protein